MFSAAFDRFRRIRVVSPARGAFIVALCLMVCVLVGAGAETVPKKNKRIIGATAVLTEANSGLPFAARIDTGAASCSLHAEQMEIENQSKKAVENLGKPIRFQIKNERGDTAWVESKIASVVRVRSSALKDGDFDRRYKVKLTLKWGDISKDVLVTLNDRADMNFPLLVGRNFLRHDFLVDVDINSRDAPLAKDEDD
jgi:hypothetical protein